MIRPIKALICDGCRLILEFGLEDVEVKSFATNYRLHCPYCNTTNQLPQALINMLDEEESEPEEEKAELSPKKISEGVEAAKALSEAGGVKTKAAKSLSISVPTLNKRLEYAEQMVAETA